MASDDNTTQALRSDADLAAIAAREHALNPTAQTAYAARVSCASLGLDYPAMIAACQRRSEDLVRGPVDPGLALDEVARALSRAADRMRRRPHASLGR